MVCIIDQCGSGLLFDSMHFVIGNVSDTFIREFILHLFKYSQLKLKHRMWQQKELKLQMRIFIETFEYMN